MIYDMTHGIDIDDCVSQSVDSNPEQELADSTVAHKDNTDVSGAILYDGCQQHIDGYDNEDGEPDREMEELSYDNEDGEPDREMEEPSDLRPNAKEDASDIKERRPKKSNDIIVKGLGGMSNRNAAFRNMLHTMFYLANLGGFRIEGHIRFVDVYTGKVYD